MSKKSKSTTDAATIEALRARLIATIQFIESLHEFPSGEGFRAAIERAAAEDNIRTLRLLGREIDAMATVALPQHERDGLDALLQDQLGVNREAERAAWSERVAVAIKRGTIVSEVERRHLEDYAEQLEATGGDPAELEAVRRLLNTS
jgi:hypothetical protein